MGIPRANLTVAAVNQEFRALVAGNSASCINCLLLGLMDGSGALRACTTNCPAIVVGRRALLLKAADALNMKMCEDEATSVGG